MGKALGIDFGAKRTGIAITDAMQIIAGGLTTVLTHLLDDFIDDYTKWYAEEEGIKIPEEPQEQKEEKELLTRNEWIRNSNSLDDSIRRL
ncbi:MAG: hypothetical protein HOM24_01600, partial [Flavobacteriales bacterium]|nr:hypothetical protein [Flavobacteriales bacterium]